MRAVIEERSTVALATETRVPAPVAADRLSDALSRDLVKRATLVFVPLALVATLVIAFVYHVTTAANTRVLQAGQEKIVQMGRTSVNASLNALASDISFLREEGALRDWLSTGDPVLQTKV